MEESDRLQWENDDLENIHERTRWKSMEFQSVSIKYGLRTADYGLRTGYKIEILGGGSLNQEPDKNAIFFAHFRHGLGL